MQFLAPGFHFPAGRRHPLATCFPLWEALASAALAQAAHAPLASHLSAPSPPPLSPLSHSPPSTALPLFLAALLLLLFAPPPSTRGFMPPPLGLSSLTRPTSRGGESEKEKEIRGKGERKEKKRKREKKRP